VISDDEADLDLLDHVLECIDRVEQYTEKNPIRFFQSVMVQDASVRNLQIMAESTQRLSDAIKASEANIPWGKIAGFRNNLVHSYFDIDENLVWIVIEKDLPSLKQAILRMKNRLVPNWKGQDQ